MLLKFILVFKKINNEFERFIKYIDSNGSIMRYGSDVDKVINDFYVLCLRVMKRNQIN